MNRKGQLGRPSRPFRFLFQDIDERRGRDLIAAWITLNLAWLRLSARIGDPIALFLGRRRINHEIVFAFKRHYGDLHQRLLY